MGGSVEEAGSFWVGFVEEDEVAEAAEAEAGVSAGLGAEVGEGALEEEAGAGGLGETREGAVIFGGEGDVVEVAGLVSGQPEGGVLGAEVEGA